MMTTTSNNILFNHFLIKQFQNDKIHKKKLNHILQKHDKSFNFMHINTRNIKKHTTELQRLITEISNKTHIITLSEVCLS